MRATFGTGITPAALGSAQGVLTVSETEAAQADSVGHGVETSWHGAPFPLTHNGGDRL